MAKKTQQMTDAEFEEALANVVSLKVACGPKALSILDAPEEEFEAFLKTLRECDFCHAPEAVATVESSTDEPWKACIVCAALIMNAQWDMLLSRSEEHGVWDNVPDDAKAAFEEAKSLCKSDAYQKSETLKVVS